jgi:hypothetical protein
LRERGKVGTKYRHVTPGEFFDNPVDLRLDITSQDQNSHRVDQSVW